MSRRRHENLVAAILFAAQLNRDDDAPSGCPMCGSHAKRETGECDACGIFVCQTCNKMHMGEVRPCPGRGVPLPRKDRK